MSKDRDVLRRGMRVEGGSKKPAKPAKPKKPKKDQVKTDSRGRKRNYGKEYIRDHSSKKAKKDRSGRNAANALLNPPKGKDVHHRDGNPQNNDRDNLGEVSRKWNRGESNRRRA